MALWSGKESVPRQSLGEVPRWLQVFVVFAALAVLAAGGLVAGKAKMLVGPDERANVSYVQIIVDQHRLPVQDVDCISQSLHRLQLASPFSPCRASPGSSYEAFQAPLYYLIAAPVFAAVPRLANKVYALRGLDVFLLAIAMLALGWLAYETLGKYWAYGMALGICAFAIPAVLVEQVLVSNDALQLPLVILTLAACARAARLPTGRPMLLVAALLLGAVLLTKLTSIYMLVPFATMVLYRLWKHPRQSALIDAGLAAAIPLLMLTPWVAQNEVRYHALTADHLAHVQQEPILNPQHVHFTWAQIPALDRTIAASYMPKLCGVPQSDAAGEPLRDPVAYLFLALMLLGPLLLARRRELMRGMFTLAPLGAGILAFDATRVISQQSIDLARFLHPTLAPFGVGLALLIAGRQRQHAPWAAYLAAVLMVSAAVFWITTALPEGTVCTQHIVG